MKKNASVKDLIHDQIAGALAGAKFPIKTPKALLEASRTVREYDLLCRRSQDDRGAKQENSSRLPTSRSKAPVR